MAKVTSENMSCWQHDKNTASVDTMLLHTASAENGAG